MLRGVLLLVGLLSAATGVETDVCQVLENALDRGGSPGEYARSYSSVRSNHVPGYGNALSEIDSALAWIAKVADTNQWLKMDLLATLTVSALLVQGRRDSTEFVSAFRVYSSMSGVSKSWVAVDGGAIFYVDTGAKTTVAFGAPVVARYLRVVPVAWAVWISMRVGVAVTRSPVVVTLDAGSHWIDSICVRPHSRWSRLQSVGH